VSAGRQHIQTHCQTAAAARLRRDCAIQVRKRPARHCIGSGKDRGTFRRHFRDYTVVLTNMQSGTHRGRDGRTHLPTCRLMFRQKTATGELVGIRPTAPTARRARMMVTLVGAFIDTVSHTHAGCAIHRRTDTGHARAMQRLSQAAMLPGTGNLAPVPRGACGTVQLACARSGCGCAVTEAGIPACVQAHRHTHPVAHRYAYPPNDMLNAHTIAIFSRIADWHTQRRAVGCRLRRAGRHCVL
jgi:hypothetical protein